MPADVRAALDRELPVLSASHARQVADTVVFLDEGRVVEAGPPGELLADPRHARTREFLARVL